jgi:hypothetical protein
VVVIDNQPPTLSCATTFEVSNDVGDCGAVVDYMLYSVTTTDNCPNSNVVVDNGLQSGTRFPVATTSNTLTAVDASGNNGRMSIIVVL